MRRPLSRSLLWALLVLVGCVNVVVGVFLVASGQHGLTVAFLDVGQGDAILVEGPTGIQVLIDGGRDRSVLRELPGVIGPLDRSLDAIIETHPDADHIAGLSDVLLQYRVSYFLEPGVSSDTNTFARLQDAVSKEVGVVQILARSGMRIHLGNGAYADALYPADNVASLRETNDASVIVRVVYGDTSFLLTGDAPAWVEDRLVNQYGSALESDVLKAGHHGSKSSTDALWLATVQPDTVVISAGKDNSYGHPHPDVLARIQAAGAAALSTIGLGTITFVSDGKQILQK